MQRTCESIARLKIEHKQRTKCCNLQQKTGENIAGSKIERKQQRTECCNLQHLALSDGKNPRKYHSFSPRKSLKHCFLQGFVHVTTFDFLKNAEIPAFFAFIKAKHRFNKCKQCCNLQGFGAVTGKKTCKYQRFGVRKWLKHRYLQCFVPSTFSWNCKNSVNTSIFCDRLAKNAVIYSVFLLGFQKHWYLRCFVHLRFKKYWYLQHFCFFSLLPRKTSKRKNAVIYSILSISKSEKSSEKCVKTALFSDFRYPPNGGGGICSWRRWWATRIPAKKLSPTLLKDFWWFSGPGVGGSAVWGAPHLRALVALGRS